MRSRRRKPLECGRGAGHRNDAGGGQVDQCLREYTDGHREPLVKLRAVTDDIKSAPQVTLAGLFVVVRELGRLVGRPA